MVVSAAPRPAGDANRARGDPARLLPTCPRLTVLPSTGPKYGFPGLSRIHTVRLARPTSTPQRPRDHRLAGSRLWIDITADGMGSMALNELGKMLTAAEVAEMLHLHVNTVKRLGDRGELKYYRVCKRGDRRFLLEDVRRFLDQNR